MKPVVAPDYKKANKGNQMNKKWIYYSLLPLILFVSIFYLYPSFEVIRLSFTNTNLFRSGYKYTLDSFVLALGDKDFLLILKNTIYFTLFSVIFQMLAGLIISVIIVRGERRRIKGAVLVRTIVLASWVMPGVVIGIIWKMLLASGGTGIVNYLLVSMGFKTIPFLNAGLALFSVIISNIWRGTAFSMVLQYAGLKSIPTSYYEAARVDGASPFQVFRYITVPQLRPVLIINFALATILTSNVFDMIYSMTGGGPAKATEVLALSAYKTVFVSGDIGRGTAMACILLVINLLVANLYFRAMGKE